MQHNVTTNIDFDTLEFTMDDAPAITSQMVSGGCSYSAECHCKMFRISNSDEPFTCFCTHDVSVHEIIGVIEGGMKRCFGNQCVLYTKCLHGMCVVRKRRMYVVI